MKRVGNGTNMANLLWLFRRGSRSTRSLAHKVDECAIRMTMPVVGEGEDPKTNSGFCLLVRLGKLM